MGQGAAKSAVDRFDRATPPDQVRELMRELRKCDPHLLAIFNAWWFDLKTEATAAAVRRFLLAEGCQWVRGEWQFRKQYNAMRRLSAGHLQRIKG